MSASKGGMSRRVRRRQKKLSGAVNRAIDEAIELFWLATGINTTCRRGALKRRGRERDADLVVVVGAPRFGAVRGHAPAPAKAFVQALSHRFRTFVINEFNTSKSCDRCGAALLRTRAHSIRYWRCPHAGGAMTKGRDGKRRHSAEINKDVSAARNMLIIALSLWSNGVRPIEFTADAPANAKRKASGGGGGGKAKKPKKTPKKKEKSSADVDSDLDFDDTAAAKRARRSSGASATTTAPVVDDVARSSSQRPQRLAALANRFVNGMRGISNNVNDDDDDDDGDDEDDVENAVVDNDDEAFSIDVDNNDHGDDDDDDDDDDCVGSKRRRRRRHASTTTTMPTATAATTTPTAIAAGDRLQQQQQHDAFIGDTTQGSTCTTMFMGPEW